MASLEGANTGPVVKWVDHIIKPIHHHSPERDVLAQGVLSIHISIKMTLRDSFDKKVRLKEKIYEFPFEDVGELGQEFEETGNLDIVNPAYWVQCYE